MQLDLDDDLDELTGGLARGGEFGEDAVALSPTRIATSLATRISPNLVIGGCMALGGVWLLSSLVAGLGQANPNNQLLQSQQAQTEANGAALTATTDALKTIAEQKPAYSCNALVCVMPPQAPTQPTQPAQQPIPSYPPEAQPPQYAPPYESVPTTYQPAAAPNGPTSPDWWRQQWQQDPAYVQQWIDFCLPQGPRGPVTGMPECRALSQAY